MPRHVQPDISTPKADGSHASNESLFPRLMQEVDENQQLLASLTGGAIATAAIVVAIRTRSVHIPVLSASSTTAIDNVLRTALKSGNPLAKLYAQVSPSVAKVETLEKVGGEVTKSIGSAFSISRDGKLLTAKHVINDTIDFALVDAKGSIHEAKVIASDEQNDLALLQLVHRSSFKNFPPLKIARDLKLSLKADEVAALGHPDGLNDVFISPGNVQAHPVWNVTEANRLVTSMRIEPGNSGGPLVNKSGEVVGVTIKKFTAQLGTEQISFQKSTTIGVADDLLLRASQKPPVTDSVASAQNYVRQWDIADRPAARLDLEALWQGSLSAKRHPKAFHSVYTDVLSSDGTDFLMRTSINIQKREVTVRPVALKLRSNEMQWGQWRVNVGSIPDGMRWGQSRVKDAELVIKLDRKFNPVSMISHDDPKDVLHWWLKEKGSVMTTK